MSLHTITMPDLGEGIAEVELVAWRVEPGDTVTEDELLAEVMTDKATVTITSPRAGKVLETRGSVGTVVPVHSVLVVYDLDGGAHIAAVIGSTVTEADTSAR